jgi:hypothetical protein
VTALAVDDVPLPLLNHTGSCLYCLGTGCTSSNIVVVIVSLSALLGKSASGAVKKKYARFTVLKNPHTYVKNNCFLHTEGQYLTEWVRVIFWAVYSIGCRKFYIKILGHIPTIYTGRSYSSGATGAPPWLYHVQLDLILVKKSLRITNSKNRLCNQLLQLIKGTTIAIIVVNPCCSFNLKIFVPKQLMLQCG